MESLWGIRLDIGKVKPASFSDWEMLIMLKVYQILTHLCPNSTLFFFINFHLYIYFIEICWYLMSLCKIYQQKLNRSGKMYHTKKKLYSGHTWAVRFDCNKILEYTAFLGVHTHELWPLALFGWFISELLPLN